MQPTYNRSSSLNFLGEGGGFTEGEAVGAGWISRERMFQRTGCHGTVTLWSWWTKLWMLGIRIWTLKVIWTSIWVCFFTQDILWPPSAGGLGCVPFLDFPPSEWNRAFDPELSSSYSRRVMGLFDLEKNISSATPPKIGRVMTQISLKFWERLTA